MDLDASARRPAAARRQHLLRRVDAGHARAAAGQHQRRPAGAGADVEDRCARGCGRSNWPAPAPARRRSAGRWVRRTAARRTSAPSPDRRRRCSCSDRRRADFRHARSLATAAGAPGGAQQRRAGLPRPLEVRVVAVLRRCQALRATRRPPPPGRDRSAPPGCRPRTPACDAPVSIAVSSLEHLRVGQQPGGDDRLARAQVLSRS